MLSSFSVSISLIIYTPIFTHVYKIFHNKNLFKIIETEKIRYLVLYLKRLEGRDYNTQQWDQTVNRDWTCIKPWHHLTCPLKYSEWEVTVYIQRFRMEQTQGNSKLSTQLWKGQKAHQIFINITVHTPGDSGDPGGKNPQETIYFQFPLWTLPKKRIGIRGVTIIEAHQ